MSNKCSINKERNLFKTKNRYASLKTLTTYHSKKKKERMSSRKSKHKPKNSYFHPFSTALLNFYRHHSVDISCQISSLSNRCRVLSFVSCLLFGFLFFLNSTSALYFWRLRLDTEMFTIIAFPIPSFSFSFTSSNALNLSGVIALFG